MRAMLDAVTKDIDGSALVDLALEAREKLAARGTVLVKAEGRGNVGLCCVQEGAELNEVYAVFAVVVVVIARGPAEAASGRTRFAHGVRPEGGSQGSPVSASQMRRSKPRSNVSVVTSFGLSDRHFPEFYRLYLVNGLPGFLPSGCCTLGHAVAKSTMIANLLPARFCSCHMLGAVLTIISYPSSSGLTDQFAVLKKLQALLTGFLYRTFPPDSFGAVLESRGRTGSS